MIIGKTLIIFVIKCCNVLLLYSYSSSHTQSTYFEVFEDLQHTYSWMKYYTELDVNKRDEGVLKDLLNVKYLT